MRKNRKRIRIIKIIIYIVLAIIILSAFLSFVFFTNVFSIKEIQVINNSKVDSETIIQKSGIQTGKNLFLVSENGVRDNLKQIPFIESVTIKKKIPNKVEIDIKERVANLLIKINEDYYAIDKNGMILEKVENLDNNSSIIIVLSNEPENITIGSFLNEKEIEKIAIVESILQVAESNDMSGLITQFDMINDQNIIIEIASESKRAYLGSFSDDINLNVKFFWLKTMLEQEKGKSGIIYLNGDLNKNKVVFSEQNI